MASIARAAYGRERVNSGLPLANSGEAVLWQSAQPKLLTISGRRAPIFRGSSHLRRLSGSDAPHPGFYNSSMPSVADHLQRFSAHRYAGFHAHRSQQRHVHAACCNRARRDTLPTGSPAVDLPPGRQHALTVPSSFPGEILIGMLRGKGFILRFHSYRCCGSSRLFSVNRSEKEKRNQ